MKEGGGSEGKSEGGMEEGKEEGEVSELEREGKDEGRKGKVGVRVRGRGHGG